MRAEFNREVESLKKRETEIKLKKEKLREIKQKAQKNASPTV